tara:strand:- start:2620 stop:5148 length:2529 start_codon:yes stop_codon:yes gene_type:complete
MALYPSDAAGNPVSRPLSKIYKKIGIRRERDLGDLSSPIKGLENLLDSLVDDQTKENFITSDLNAIKNIFARGLEPSGYQNIVGSSTKFSTPTGLERTFDPRITYQNRLDKFEIFTGEPRLAGGDGLTAKYYQNDQINFDSITNFKYNKSGSNDPLDPNLPESDVFIETTSEGKIENDKFWEKGQFNYTGKVHPQSVKANTGVQWEGYYIPRKTGEVSFNIRSTGFFTMDFAKEGYLEDNNKNQTPESESNVPKVNNIPQVYTSHMRIGISTVVTGTGGLGNEITVPLNRIPTIGIGMSVSGTNINSTGGAPIVGSIDRTTGVITLTPVSGQTNSVTGTLSGSDNVTFARPFGESVSSSFTTYVLSAFEKYRIRIRYFHPKVTTVGSELDELIKKTSKSINIDHLISGSTFVDINFRYLYSLDYNFSESVKGSFNDYYDKSVLFGGTVLGVGLGSRINDNEYVRLKTKNKINLKYKVKENLSKITKVSSRSGSFKGGSNIISMNPTSSIEVGNYIFGTNISPDTRVESITINQFISISKNTEGSGSQTENLTFIDHRGFVKKITCDGSGTQLTNSNPAVIASPQTPATIDTDVQVGMVVIGSSTNFESFTQIDSITGTDTLNLNKSLKQNFTGGDVYIYQSRGLKDNSIQKFCDRFSSSPKIRCLISDHATTDADGNPTTYTTQIGITTVKVSDLNGVGSSWELQGAYFGQNGIKVDQVLPNNVLKLDSGMTRPLPDGAQFTAVENVDNIQSGDYQLCCPPTDTSPPFNSSEEGLNTTSTYPNLKLNIGNLVFDSLIIKDTNSNAYNLPSNSTKSVNRTIDIKTGDTSGNYKLLASSNQFDT